MGSSGRLLFLLPRQPASPTPLLDRLTRRMCAAFRLAKHGHHAYGGTHECYCGAMSSRWDYHLPGGDLTNSLCVHYLAHHRADVDERQSAIVDGFTFGEAEPTEGELQGPEYLLSRVRNDVERELGPDRLRTWSAWGLDLAALSRALRGGCLPDPEPWTPTRRDAEDLLDLLCSLPPEALSGVQAGALRSHGDVAAWGAEALRVVGWDRGAWLSPLDEILQLPEDVLRDKRPVRMLRERLEARIEGRE
jgi:hypothetical protein